MTKRELIVALAEVPDDADIFVGWEEVVMLSELTADIDGREAEAHGVRWNESQNRVFLTAETYWCGGWNGRVPPVVLFPQQPETSTSGRE